MSTPSLTRGDTHTRAGVTAESSLGRLPLGVRAIITAVGTAQQEAGTAQGRLARRLQDLGLIPGRAITARRRAPLGDPTVFQVADYELCLRRHDADLVTVRVVEDGDPAEQAAGAAS